MGTKTDTKYAEIVERHAGMNWKSVAPGSVAEVIRMQASDPDAPVLNKWDKATKARVEEAVKVLCDAVNSASDEVVAKAIFTGLVKEHRTLQASLIRSILKGFDIYADASYDARNKGAVVTCECIRAFKREESLGIPFI